MPAKAKPPIVRFVPKLIQRGDCWEWNGARTPKNYGTFFDGSRLVPAHRWSYEYHIGPIPKGLSLDHLCRNRACVNPWHLEPVTARVNSYRSPLVRPTHCPRGHEFTEANTYYRPDTPSRRQCRTCIRRRSAARFTHHAP